MLLPSYIAAMLLLYVNWYLPCILLMPFTTQMFTFDNQILGWNWMTAQHLSAMKTANYILSCDRYDSAA